MPFYDAHCHSPSEGSSRAVINSSQPSEWPHVAELAAGDSRLIPSYGLHPWFSVEAPPDWLAQLRARLAAHPRAQVGEIGLDRAPPRHITPVAIDVQRAALTAQLALAAQLARVATLHCTRAHGLLLDVLRSAPARPPFLLHAYSGSTELAREFAELGAYFSFGAQVLAPQRERARAALRAVPPERLLAETDNEAGRDPGDIAESYRALASVLGKPLDALGAQIEANFTRLFGA